MSNEINFILNSYEISLDNACSDILLDILRNDLKLKGTKEVCKEGDCGACTVLIGENQNGNISYKNVNSCIYHKSYLKGKHVVTIEGLRFDSGLSLIQKMFYEEGATQCGYCTPGFIISTTGYFLNLLNRKPGAFNDEYNKLLEFVSGNICRCTGHISIRRSLNNLLQKFYGGHKNEVITIDLLINENILPEYFREIIGRLPLSENYLSSGGTDLFVQNMNNTEGINPKRRKTDDTEKIFIKGNDIVIDAFATVSDICESEILLKYFPEISKYRELFGSIQIRNKATAGGNIVNASPIGDTVNILMALDANLILSSQRGNRTISLKNFYTGYKTNVMDADEILSEIRIAIPHNQYIFSYEKISKRMHLDIASVNSTLYLNHNGNVIKYVSISAGGVAPYPLHLAKSCEFLAGKKISAEIFTELEKIIESEISPIDDVRGSALYKKLLTVRLVKMHFIKYYPQLASEII